MATSSIGATARDYSDLDAWWASLPATLTEAEVGELYNDSEFSKNGMITLGGVTTSASFDVRIEPASGESFRDHVNKATNALTYNQSLGVGVKNTGGYNRIIRIAADDWLVKGVQFIATGTGGTTEGIEWQAAPARTGTFDSCIVRAGNASNSAEIVIMTGGNALLVNCLVERHLSANNGDGILGSNAPDAQIVACTIVNPHLSGDAGVNANYNTFDVRGCASFGFSNNFGDQGQDIDIFDSATDLASANDSGGADSNNQTSLIFSDQFEDITETSRDFRLKAGSSLEGGAAQEGATGDFDIIGQARDVSTPDCGCWEFTVAGGGTSWPSPVKQMAHLINR